MTTRDSGELRAMHLQKPCGYAHCKESGIASIGDEDLCCDHFVLRSYEFLQQIDAEHPRGNGDLGQSAALKDSVNSCLQGALEVSLRSASLNNLQKARLLDIMLWAGEYIHRTQSQCFAGGNSPAGELAKRMPDQRTSYHKPEIRSRTSLLPQ